MENGAGNDARSALVPCWCVWCVDESRPLRRPVCRSAARPQRRWSVADVHARRSVLCCCVSRFSSLFFSPPPSLLSLRAMLSRSFVLRALCVLVCVSCLLSAARAGTDEIKAKAAAARAAISDEELAKQIRENTM